MNVTCHSIALACWRKWRNGGPAPSTKHQAHSAKYATQRCLPARKAQSTKVKKDRHIVHQIQRPAPGPLVKETKCAVTGSTKYQTPGT